eukprot:CAMPEP_0118699786 /NCGR_PEP_ID=MMETSP0800-20121206/16137_1 /TAXON_ID=210618 ORGANISM="Striatella unipunctata, Strain CCMP2910" /NCGR_SAMPLE_ID=MMETSP0800 /ASSEMBLY_ACC=CAM_ASM_000638 /LENGTH=420 /DNA_ID=CAMNT_0006600131 /DNA_START=57 /DNA_END=1319 /DNA_ORIENTATION=-
MASNPKNADFRKNVAVEAINILLNAGVLYLSYRYLMPWILKSWSDPNATDGSSRAERISGRRLVLNTHEKIMAEDVVDPEDMDVSFKDVGGVDNIKKELWELVVLPLRRPDLFFSSSADVSALVRPTRGILLYGAPGTGKTMLAKAMAKESNANFLHVRLSKIMDKWFGESNKLIAATFTLAQKLAPSIIFIDELDTFLSARDGTEGSTAASTMKSEFLTMWDGLTTQQDLPILVLGATNRPYDIDSAILRRMPRTFEIPLPDTQGRLQILRLLLSDQAMTVEGSKSLPSIARLSVGYSGSDLKELCRTAAMEPIRELTDEMARRAVGMEPGKDPSKRKTLNTTKPRPVDSKDFLIALQKVKRTGAAAKSFLRKEQEEKEDYVGQINAKDLQKLVQQMFGAVVPDETEDEDSAVPELNMR